jgi:hypothetical protein
MPMPIWVLSTARRSRVCLVVLGRAGFWKLLPVFESASVHRLSGEFGAGQPQLGEGANQ